MRRRWSFAVVTVGLAVAATVGFVTLRRSPKAELPPLLRYERLPPRFTTALQRARAEVENASGTAEPLRQLAQLYQANGLFDEARVCYQRIEKSKTGLGASDHYALADLALTLGDLDHAREELVKTIEQDPAYVPARIRLGEVLFKTGDSDGAERSYRSAIELQPDQPLAMVGLARIELQRGQEDAAVARLERLVEIRPESAAAASVLAQILDRRGQTERATAIAQASRQKPEPIPADPWLDAMLVNCFDRQRLTLKFEEYLMAGQIEAALPLLSRVEELDPQSWIPHLLRGWTQARASHHAEAINQYTLALKKGGDTDKIVPLLVRTYVAAGNLDDANTLLAKVSAESPDSVPILTSYSEVAMKRGDLATARRVLVRLLEKEPYLYNANLDLAKILWNINERPAAVECLLRIVRVFPVDVASRGLLGQYYLETGEPQSAIAPLEQALPHAGKGSPAHEKLAAMLYRAYTQVAGAAGERGELVRAAEYFGRATTLMPTELEAFAGAAGVWTQLKEFRKAAEALTRMAVLQPENPTIPLSLGDVLYQAGEHDQARQAWERAQQLTTATDTELRQALRTRLVGPITAQTFQ